MNMEISLQRIESDPTLSNNDISLIACVLGDEKKMADMSERALKAAKLNASAEIARHILSLVD